MEVIGTNHNYSSQQVREKLAVPLKKVSPHLSFFQKNTGFSATAVLSTCNRLEYYISGRKEGASATLHFMAQKLQTTPSDIQHLFYHYRDRKAFQHLCRVTAGLDSFLPGEKEIQGQVKKHFSKAGENGFLDYHLQKMFEEARNLSRYIHKNTGIAYGKVSMGSLTLDFIRDIFPDISEKKVALIGTGHVSQLVLKYLRSHTRHITIISNRHPERALLLARKYDIKAAPTNNITSRLHSIDILITATASPHFIFTPSSLRAISRPMLLIDLSHPRDIDPEVKKLSHIRLYYYEDFHRAVVRNLQHRKEECRKAEKIIKKEAYKRWRSHLKSEPVPAIWH